MKVRGNFPSLPAYVFQTPGSPCNYRVWEEKTKHHVFGLMCNGASLRSIAGSLRSFVNILWSFAGTFWSLLLVVCGFLLVVCDSLSSFVVVCWWFVIFCARLRWFEVVTCFSNYVFVSGIPISCSSVTTKFLYY